MLIYYPFKPTKGVAFTLYIGQCIGEIGATPANSTFNTHLISKDGGTMVATTNNPVAIDNNSITNGRGRAILTLTATEMDADVVMLIFADSGGGNQGPFTVVIHTDDGSDSGGGDEPGVTNFKTDILNLIITGIQTGYDLVDAALAESGSNYYGIRKNNSNYLVVKENIIAGTLTFAYRTNNSGKGYQNVWDSRAGSLYSSSQTQI